MFKKLFALLLTVSMLLTMTYIPAVANETEEDLENQGPSFVDHDILQNGWLEISSDPWQIVRGEPLSFPNLADAVNAAKDGETIVLIRDAIEAQNVTVEKSVTIATAGSAYTVNFAEGGFVVNGGSLTLSAGLSVESSSVALTVISGEAVNYANLSGEPWAFMVEGGALAIKGGVLSTDPTAYRAPGYMVEELGEGKFEVKKDETVVAIDANGNEYNDLQVAISKVNENGGKLTLAKDVLAQGIINLLPGATIDLNGYVLETEFITVYSGAFLTDSQTGDKKGMLVCEKDHVIIDTEVEVADSSKQESNQVPVWTTKGELSGYVFLNYQFKEATLEEITEGQNCLIYKFRFYTQAGSEYFANGATPCGVSIMVELSWVNANGDLCVENVIYSDAQVQSVTGTSGGAYTLSVTGYEGFKDITFRAVVVSETGMTTATPLVKKDLVHENEGEM